MTPAAVHTVLVRHGEVVRIVLPQFGNHSRVIDIDIKNGMEVRLAWGPTVADRDVELWVTPVNSTTIRLGEV